MTDDLLALAGAGALSAAGFTINLTAGLAVAGLMLLAAAFIVAGWGNDEDAQ
jgi:hypothetical protein